MKCVLPLTRKDVTSEGDTREKAGCLCTLSSDVTEIKAAVRNSN